LGEHVEGVTTLEVVAGFNEMFQVAGEGAWIAGDVNDLLGVKVNQSLRAFKLRPAQIILNAQPEAPSLTWM
jgi:hypothetical protein